MIGSSLLTKMPAEGGDVNRSWLKILVMGGTFVFLGLWLSFSMRSVFLDPAPQVLALFFSGAVLFLSVFVLLPLLIKDFLTLSVFMFLGSLSLNAFFYREILQTPIVFGIAAVLNFLFFLWAAIAERYEHKQFLKVHIFRLTRVSLSKALNALIIFSILVYVFAVQGIDVSAGGDFFISKPQFRKLVSFIPQTTINYFIPGFAFDKPFDEALIPSVRSEIQQEFAAGGLPLDVSPEILNTSLSELAGQVSDFLGFQINRQMEVAGILYEAAKISYLRLAPETRGFVGLALLFLLFLSLKFITWPLRFVIYIITIIIFEFLLATLFMAIIYESRAREIIIL